jgi:ABC-type transporter Mla subunit MlaD
MKGATWKDLLALKEVRNFLTGAILVASALVFATALFAYLIHNEFLERKYTVYALYEDGTGMSRGAKVLLNGVQVGTVQGVRLTPDARVVLALDLQLKYQSLIRRHSVAYFKRDRNMVSDRVLNIEKCDLRDTILAAGDTLRLGSPQDIETALGSLANLTAQFRTTLTRVDSLLHMVTDTHTTIGAVLVKDDLYRKTLRTVQSIDHAANQSERTISRLDHLAVVMEKSVPRLLEQSDSLATRLNRTARSADTMGALGVNLLRRGDSIASQVKVLTGNGGKLIDDGQSMLDASRKHWLVGKVVGGAKKPEEKKPIEDSAKK